MFGRSRSDWPCLPPRARRRSCQPGARSNATLRACQARIAPVQHCLRVPIYLSEGRTVREAALRSASDRHEDRATPPGEQAVTVCAAVEPVEVDALSRRR